MLHWFGSSFPWGTFSANLIGSFIMGFVAEGLALKFHLSPEMRSFVMTGLLGGFTTFSAFSLDAANMMERGDGLLSLLYVGGSVIGAIAALFAGLYFVRLVLV
jgi:CrcB protein